MARLPRSSAITSADATLRAAVQAVRRHDRKHPLAGIILGSGLGGLADEIASPVVIDYAALPGFVRATAGGHRGQLVCGTLDSVQVVVMAGRVHRYEGHDDEAVTFPVRLMAALGARRLILSNAAGGLNPLLNVGDIVVIEDHLDLARTRLSDRTRRESGPADGAPIEPEMAAMQSLRGAGLVGSAREIYDRKLCQTALRAARAGDFHAALGVYLATLGPTYETRAEYRMMRALGADVVGMSTAPEATMAAALGMQVLALSVVSNVARPDAMPTTDHQEVLAIGRSAASKLRCILTAALNLPPA